MNNVKMLVLSVLLALGFSNAFASSVASAMPMPLQLATIPAELDTLLTDVGTTWGTIKTLVLGFLVFSIIVFVVLKVRNKKGS